MLHSVFQRSLSVESLEPRALLAASVTSPVVQIIDNGDAGFTATGSWSYQSGQGRGNDVHYSAGGIGDDVATWRFTVSPGQYRVSATWTPHHNRSTDAPYTILDGSRRLTTVRVNQEPSPNDHHDNGSAWKRLGGTYTVSGTTLVVQLSDDANQFVVADAVRVERMAGTPSTPGVQIIDNGDPGFQTAGNWSYYVQSGYQGDVHYSSQGSGRDVATWTFDVTPGQYRVSATWSEHPNRATNALFRIFDGTEGRATVSVNQERAPNDRVDAGAHWEDLGSPYQIASGRIVVRLPDNANEYVIADAVRVERVGPLPGSSGEQIIDNGDAGFSVAGDWTKGGSGRQNDVHYSARGTGRDVATWSFYVTPGQYRVSATWSEHPNRATNAFYRIFDGSRGLATVTVNQELAPDDRFEQGSYWEDLGGPYDVTETNLIVRLPDNANEYVIADAIRVQRIGDLPPPDETAEVAELPRRSVDTRYLPPTGGTTWIVRAGDNLQQFLDAAQPGDVIELEANATFVGNFRLRNKTGDDWIYIRSSAHDRLPAEGTRVSPSDADQMPKIVSPNVAPAIEADFGAHHYRLVGIEIATTHATTNFTNANLVLLGHVERDANLMAELPHHIVFDRVYVHGTATGNVRRGLAINSRVTAVIDSYLSDFHEVGADSQAIECWNGSGPFKIVNNYIEGAGENIMFGGGLPAIRGLVPSDIEIRGNHFAKPNAWRVGHPDYASIQWSVKNLLELKNARRVLVEGNLFENSWIGAQHGFAIVLTPRSESGRGPWMAVQDVTIRNNVIRDAGAGVHISSGDISGPSQETMNILIENNLMYNINRSFDGSGAMLGLVGYVDLPPIRGLTVRHNTFLHRGEGNQFVSMGDGGSVVQDFVFTDNIVTYGDYGLHGSGAGVGEAALKRYAEGYRVQDNLIVGAPSSDSRLYPAGNLFALAISDVGFEDYDHGDYRLSVSSPYWNAGSDDGILGADVAAVETLAARAVAGQST